MGLEYELLSHGGWCGVSHSMTCTNNMHHEKNEHMNHEEQYTVAGELFHAWGVASRASRLRYNRASSGAMCKMKYFVCTGYDFVTPTLCPVLTAHADVL